MERRRAGPGDFVREALVGGLAGAVAVEIADLRIQKPGLGIGVRLVVILGSWRNEACAHLVRPGPLAQLCLVVVPGALVPGVWSLPQG